MDGNDNDNEQASVVSLSLHFLSVFLEDLEIQTRKQLLFLVHTDEIFQKCKHLPGFDVTMTSR